MNFFGRIKALLKLQAALGQFESDLNGGDMKKWFPSLVSLAVMGSTIFLPQIQALVATHPAVAVVLGGIFQIVSHLMPSPTQSTTPAQG